MNCHPRYTAGCPDCRERSRAQYRRRSYRPEVKHQRAECLCGCGQPVGEGFISYASTECMFKGAGGSNR